MEIYNHPEKFGLTQVGQVDWDGGDDYGFDFTVVWKDKNGNLYWASDAGCSCPSPFEDFSDDLSELETGSFFDLAKFFNDRCSEHWSNAQAQAEIVDLLGRLR